MTDTKPHFSFWLFAGVGLIWNLTGCLNYIVQTNPANFERMPEIYQVIIAGRPAWATGAFAITVFGGAVGCILLLLRKRVAMPILVLSFAGNLLSALFILSIIGFTPAAVLSLLVGIALLWYASIARRQGWLH